jgi:hypothetical protein
MAVLLGWQGSGAGDGFVHPSIEVAAGQAVGVHGDEAAHPAAGEIHRAGVGPGERVALASGAEATISSSRLMPQHMLPLIMKVSPPDIFRSLTSARLARRARTRAASRWS